MARPSREEVQATFNLFNVAFFGGVLHTPVHWRRMKDYGECHDASGKYPYGLILLSTMLPRGIRWDEVLLHEMVHAYLDLFGVDEYAEGKVQFHGPRFCDEVNRIGEFLGLPPVDEENCWAWPFCVKWNYNPELARPE